MLARTDSRVRAVVMLVAVTLVAGLIGYRLVWWQVIDRERLAAMGEAQLAHVQQIPATRGLILDREGMILATSLTTESVFATPPTVDDPERSVDYADALLAEVMSARGYPVSDFDQRAGDISVDHPNVVQHYRAGHEIAMKHNRGEASTDELRQALIHYRSLFEELVTERATLPEHSH